MKDQKCMFLSERRQTEKATYCMMLEVKSLSRVRLCDPVDCSLPGSSVHGIFQARVLEWVAISFSRGSFQPRGQTQVTRIIGRRFTVWAIREMMLTIHHSGETVNS